MTTTPATSLARAMELLRHPSLSVSLAAFSDLSELKRAHARALVSGLAADPFTFARLLLASAARDLPYAAALFRAFPSPTLFMFNTMVRALSGGPDPADSLRLYARMLRSGLSPDRLTLPFLVRSCYVLALPRLGRALHGHAARLGLDSDVYVVNNAITMYSSVGDVASARRLFDENSNIVDVVSWTAMVTGHANCGELHQARRLFDRMPSRNLVSWVVGYDSEKAVNGSPPS